MAVDIEEELLAFDTDLTRRAARYIRIKRRTIEGLEQQLRRCQEIMECNDPGNARDLFGPAPETVPAPEASILKAFANSPRRVQETFPSPGPMPSFQQFDCYKCANGQTTVYMILCPLCGNKRCPKASDHSLACTNSNAPGQPGSVYQL